MRQAQRSSILKAFIALLSSSRTCSTKNIHENSTAARAPSSSSFPSIPPLKSSLSSPVATHSTVALNQLSTRVRQHLTLSGAPSRSSGSGSGHSQQHIIEGLLSILSSSSPSYSDISSDKRSGPSPSLQQQQEHLHPLLSVKVLELLGYAVWDHGWTTHQHTALPPSSASTAYVASLVKIGEHVLVPLRKLTGLSGSGNGAPHPQVAPVIPQILEWLCALPPLPQLPVESWMPLLVRHYSHKDCSDAEERGEHSDDNKHKKSHVPLSFLLPLLLAKLHVTSSSGRAAAAASEGGGGSDAAVQEQRQVLLSCLLRSLACESERAAEKMLFWHNQVPLLSAPLVREAFVRSQMQGKKVGSRVNPPEAGGSKDSSPDNGRPPGVLTVLVTDDDVFRRLLLRLTTSTFATKGASPRQHHDDAMLSERKVARSVYIEPVLAPSLLAISLFSEAGAPSSTAVVTPATDKDATDVVLRFINPLHEFLMTTYASTGASDRHQHRQQRGGSVGLELSFVGLVGVLSAVMDHLQILRKQSCCRYAFDKRGRHQHNGDSEVMMIMRGVDSGEYTLLPQKPRLHVLKNTCELLLHHVRTIQKQQKVGNVEQSTACEDAWFTDVSICQQELVLRRLCGASRALVRVVQEEKRQSLLREGPEGSALTAGTQPSSRVAPSSTFSTASLADVLRNTAYRVLEPALWRYYEVCTHSPSEAIWEGGGDQRATAAMRAPLTCIDYDQLREVCCYVEDAVESHHDVPAYTEGNTRYHIRSRSRPLGTDAPVTTWRNSSSNNNSTAGLLIAEDHLLPLYRALKDVDVSIGGIAASLATARHVLQRPASHPVAAVVEALRLIGMHELAFNYRDSEAAYKADSGEPSGVRVSETNIAQSFFSVWQRTLTTSYSVTTASFGAAGSSSNGGCGSSREDSESTMMHAQQQQQHLQSRLLLMLLLLLIKRSARASPFSAVVAGLAMSPAQSAMATSLLGLLTEDGTRSEWALVGVEELLCGIESRMPSSPSSSLSSSSSQTRLFFPPDGAPSGSESVWELTEELRGFSDHDETAATAAAKGTTEWHWLGTPAAVHAVAATIREYNDFRNASGDGDGDHAVSTGELPLAHHHLPTRFLLLPWSTLASAAQPLRLYDESGQSARAAEWFAADLQTIMTYCMGLPCSEASSESNHNEESSSSDTPAVTLRFVSIAEEMTLFSSLVRHQSHLTLAPDVTVRRDDLEREKMGLTALQQEMSARAVQAEKMKSKGQSDGEETLLSGDTYWDDDDDYDGLD